MARLVVARGLPVTTDALIEDVWGGRSTPGAVRTTITRLRDQLGPSRESIRHVTSSYRLDLDGLRVDVFDFESFLRSAEQSADPHAGCVADALAKAIRLWSGRPYDGFDAPFLDIERAHLEQRWLTAVEQRSLQLGDRLSLTDVDDLERLAVDHPEREGLVLQAMRALHHAGRVPEALALVRRHRESAVDRWGIDPGSAVLAYELELLSGPAPGLTRPVIPRFAGRRDELDALRQACSQTATERCIVVEGDPGVGKSSLLAALSAHASLHLISSTCQRHAVKPMSVMTELVEAAAPLVDAEVVESLAPGFVALLSRLSPALRRRVRIAESLAPRGARELVVTQLTSFLQRVPVDAIVIDDIQWADEMTMDVICNLARAAERPALILAVRTGCRELWETRLDDSCELGIIQLEGVDDATATALLQSIGITPATEAISELVRRTAGNPLFLLSFVEQGWQDHDHVPTDVLVALNSRLDTLDSTTRAALEVAAIMGEHFAIGAVEAVMPNGTAALERAERAGLVHLDEDHGSFQHELIATAAYDQIADGRRVDLHDRIGHALARFGAAAPSVARHYAIASVFDPARAIAALDAAARYHENNFAYVAATEAWRQAIELLENVADVPARRIELLIELGRVERLTSVPGHAQVLFNAAALAEQFGLDDLYVRAVAQLCDAGETTDSRLAVGRIAPMLDRALAVGGCQRSAAELRIAATMTLAVTGNTDRARTLFLEALATAETLDDDDLREQVILAAYTGLVSPDDVGLIAMLANEARERAVSSPRLQWSAAHFSLTSAVIRGERKGVDESLSDLRDALLVSPEPVREYGLAYTEAAVLHLDGELEAAERQLERAFELGVKAYPAGWVRSIDRTILLAIRLDQGRADELVGLFATRDRTGDAASSHRAASSYVALLSGDRAVAVDELERATSVGFESLPRDHLWTMGMYFYSLIASELEDDAAASKLHRLFAPYSGRMTWSGVVSFGPVDDALGRLAVTCGRRTAAADHLRAASGLCVRLRAPRMQDRVESAMALLPR